MSNNVLLDDEHLTRDEAQARAELINITSYEVELDLSNAMELDESTYPVTTTINFRANTVGAETFLNYLGSSVDSVTLNNVELDVSQVVGAARIVLPDLASENQVVVRSHSTYSHSGEGLHRFVDPVDGQVYLYSQFEPADARRVYPNMEQPDLKAPFHISIIGPDTWTLASNGAEIAREQLDEGLARVHFEPTKPVSTYLTTFLAGPYAQFQDTWPGHAPTGAAPIELRIFARQSLVDHVDAAELFAQTQQGLTWFHDQFQIAYPWGKYDQAFVPEYNLGAMENPGLVTFNESYIFTSRATVSQHMQRATTLMHEMSHMWFGNLVTMKWWDDLWLKESFADFYGTKAVAEATALPGAWQSFAHQRKGWAYRQDSYPTTHPIVADIVDLEAARQNFDGITYAKGAAVIKQLFHYVGEEAFVQACRTYFERYAYSTAQLADFLAILEEHSGRSMGEWARSWLQTSGPATLQATIDSSGAVTVHQESVDPNTGREVLRPHALYVAVFELNEQEELISTAESDVLLAAGETSARADQLNAPVDVPRAVIVNQHDQTYAQVKFDDETLQAVTSYPIVDPESTAVATVWSTLWTMVRQASLPASDFIRAVAKLSNSIEDVSMHARVLEQSVEALKEFAPTSQRNRLTKQLATALLDALVQLEPGSDRQRSAARAFAQLGRGTETVAAELTFLLAANEHSELSPGLEVDDEIKWSLLISLASLGRVDIARLDEELALSHTATNELRHRTAVAALPDQSRQAALWKQVFNGTDAHGRALSNAEITATASGLRASAPRDDKERLQRLLEGLTTIWGSRSNNLATRTINGLFPMRHSPVKGGPDAQQQHPVVVNIDAWLAQYQDAPAALRRIVIERRADILDRLRAQAAVRKK
ncbi:MAG TPA: aminopeptidase N [Enteractinococcus sp.]